MIVYVKIVNDKFRGKERCHFLGIIISMHVQYDWKLAIATVIASVIIFGLLDIALLLLGKYIYTSCFSVGILLTAGLQVPCIVKKMHKSTKNRR